MTSNQLSRAKLEEEKRANQASEDIKKTEVKEKVRAGKWSRAKDFIKGAAKLGTIIGSINDPSWYSKDPTQVKAAANISYGKPLGSKTDNIQTMVKASDKTRKTLQTTLPGVMAIRYIPMIPDASTMDIIAKNLYAYVRHANSGHANYEAHDLMMYILAVTEGYTGVALAQRLYSLLNTFKSENMFYAKGMIEAQGFDYDSFANNIADFRYTINNWSRRLNSFCVPNNFTLFMRRMWLATNVFKDYPIKRSSEYLFTPDHILVYSEDTYARLVANNLGTSDNKMTYQAFIELMNRLIDSIFNSEDLGIMSGDILKAYGESGLFKLNEIEADFHIESIYSAEVLSQINGASVMGPVVPGTSDIYTTQDDAGYTHIQQGNHSSKSTKTWFSICELGADTGYVVDMNDIIINMYKDEVTVDDNMVATRLTCGDVATDVDPSGSNFVYTRCPAIHGTEVVTRVTCCRKTLVNNVLQYDYQTNWDGDAYGMTNVTTSVDNTSSIASKILFYTNLDWAPRIRLCVINNNSTYIIFDNKDLCNYAIIDKETLFNMHQVAFLSLFNV